MFSELVRHSGAWIVSDIVGGYRVARTYYGYTRDQALAAFGEEIDENFRAYNECDHCGR